MIRIQKMHVKLILPLSILLLCAACSGSNIGADTPETSVSLPENESSMETRDYIEIQNAEISAAESGLFKINISLDLLSDDAFYIGMLTGTDGGQIFIPCYRQSNEPNSTQLECLSSSTLAKADFQLEVVTITTEFAEYVSNYLQPIGTGFVTQTVAYWDSWSACKNWAISDRKPDYMDDYCAETYPETGWAYTDPDDIWLDLQNQDEPFNCLCFNWPYVEDIVEREIPVTWPDGHDDLCNFASNTFGLDICPTVWDLNGDYLILTENERDPFNSPGYLYDYADDCFACESSPCCTDDNKTMLKYLYCSAGHWYDNNPQFGDEQYYIEDNCISQEHYDLANQCIQYNGWQHVVQVNTEDELINFYRYMLENYNQGQWITPCKDFLKDLWDCTYEFEYIVPDGWEGYSSMLAPDCDRADSENSPLCQSLSEEDPISNLAFECAEELNISEFDWPYSQFQAISILESYFHAKPFLEPDQAPMCKLYSQFADLLLEMSTGKTTFDLFIANVPHLETISGQVSIKFPNSTLSSRQGEETSQNEAEGNVCETVRATEAKLVVVGFLDESDTFVTYLKFSGPVPGTSGAERSLSYYATLGDLPEARCSVNEDYPERLYCIFNDASSIAGTASQFKVSLEGCNSPIIKVERVSLVRNSQEEPTDQDSCKKPDPPSSDPCYIWFPEKCAWECIN